jgi:hypothetical protein
MTCFFSRCSVLFTEEAWIYFVVIRHWVRNDNGLSFEHEQWLRERGIP